MGTISILLWDQLVRLLQWILRTVDSLFSIRVSWDVFLGLLVQILRRVVFTLSVFLSLDTFYAKSAGASFLVRGFVL